MREVSHTLGTAIPLRFASHTRLPPEAGGPPDAGPLAFAIDARQRLAAFAVYQRDDAGLYRLFGIQVLTFAGNYISDATTFIDPALFPHFGLPLQVNR